MDFLSNYDDSSVYETASTLKEMGVDEMSISEFITAAYDPTDDEDYAYPADWYDPDSGPWGHDDYVLPEEDCN